MRFSALLHRYGLADLVHGHDDPIICDISADSRHIHQGSMFVALRGHQHDGTQFIPLAILSGAVAIVTHADDGLASLAYHYEGRRRVPVVKLARPAHFLAHAAAWLAGPQPPHIVAITGTNGKSSTVDFLRQLWQLKGYHAASLGTLGLNTSAPIPPLPSLTTPDAVTLAKTLAALHHHNVSHVALEASSHGLHQYRLDGVSVTAAGFSNLTRDHLDYHHDMQDYRDAKLRLFRELIPSGSRIAINSDMDTATYHLMKQTANERHLILRDIGENGATLTLLNAHPVPQGQILSLALNHQPLPEIMLPLPGRFQAENALMAAALCWEDDEDAHHVLSLLSQLKGVPGRCEHVASLANGATIYVDYAHTPDALEHVLLSLRPHTSGKLHVVFGAGGNRDTGKRPLMGQIAAHLADDTIITDDNPRDEDPSAIRAAIRATCPNALEIGDRYHAIETALHRLEPGDILLIAGKGHETGQIIESHTHPFDDRLVARTLAEKVAS